MHSMEECSEGVMRWGLVSSPKWKATGQEEMASSCTRGSLDWIYEKFLHRKGGKAQEQAAQGSGETIVPESVKNVQMWC